MCVVCITFYSIVLSVLFGQLGDLVALTGSLEYGLFYVLHTKQLPRP